MKFIIDENLPADVPLWSGSNYMHTSALSPISDSEIWKLAIETGAVIVTKDTDFYHRFLAGTPRAKVLWFRAGNMKKASFINLVNEIWNSIVELLEQNDFIIINPESIEAYQ